MHGDLTRSCLAPTNGLVARVRHAQTAAHPGITDGGARS